MRTEQEVRDLITGVILSEASKVRSITLYEISKISERLVKLLKNDGNLKVKL